MASSDVDTWACNRCSFVNPAHQNRCEMCHALHFSARKRRATKWACPTCTYENEDTARACGMCGTSKTNRLAEGQLPRSSRMNPPRQPTAGHDTPSSTEDGEDIVPPTSSGSSSPSSSNRRRKVGKLSDAPALRETASPAPDFTPETGAPRSGKRARLEPVAIGDDGGEPESNEADEEDGEEEPKEEAEIAVVDQQESEEEQAGSESTSDEEDARDEFCGLCFEAVGDSSAARHCGRCSVAVHWSCVETLGMMWGKRWRCNCYMVGLAKKLDDAIPIQRTCVACGQSQGILTCVQGERDKRSNMPSTWIHVACAILKGYALLATGDRFWAVRKSPLLNRECSQPPKDACVHCRKDKSCGALLRCYMPGCTSATHFVCALRQRSFAHVAAPLKSPDQADHVRTRENELLLVCPSHYSIIASRGRLKNKRMLSVELDALLQPGTSSESGDPDVPTLDEDEQHQFDDLVAHADDDPHEAERHNLAALMSVLVADQQDSKHRLNTVVYDAGDVDFAIAAEEQGRIEDVLPFSERKMTLQFNFEAYLQSMFDRSDPHTLALPAPIIACNEGNKPTSEPASETTAEIAAPPSFDDLAPAAMVSEEVTELLLEAMTCRHRVRAINILLEVQEQSVPPYVGQLLQDAIGKLTDSFHGRGATPAVPTRARNALRQLVCGVRRAEPLDASAAVVQQVDKALEEEPATNVKREPVKKIDQRDQAKRPPKSHASLVAAELPRPPTSAGATLPKPKHVDSSLHDVSADPAVGIIDSSSPKRRRHLPPTKEHQATTVAPPAITRGVERVPVRRAQSDPPRASESATAQTGRAAQSAPTRQSTRMSFQALDVLATYAAQIVQDQRSSSSAVNNSHSSSNTRAPTLLFDVSA